MTPGASTPSSNDILMLALRRELGALSAPADVMASSLRVLAAELEAAQIAHTAQAEAARAEADQAIAALRAAAARKDDFLAMLAHELRNPLAPIRNAVALLRAAKVPAIASLTDVLDRQSAQLARLLDDLLDVSRVGRGKVVLQRTLHDARSIVQAAVETARPLIEAKRQALVLELPAEGEGEALVHGDLARLVQALGNVVSNAAKYTPEGGRIRVRLMRDAQQPAQLAIEVSDDGIGIAPDMLPLVFELFMQANVSLERSGGLGVGLALVRQLVELHGGSVQAQSPGLGQGSCFTLRLPAASAELAAELQVPALAAVVADAAAASRRVLIVDDSRDAAETLSMLLEMEGHEVQLCHSGAEGRDRAAAERFDVVLLDLGMPGMDGLATARAIRAGGASRTALLIATTGYGQPEDRARTQDAGFDVHLVKPLEVDELCQYVRGGAPARLGQVLTQRVYHPKMQRFHDIWRELRPASGGSRWPPLSDFLQATHDLGMHRALTHVQAYEPVFSMSFMSIGLSLGQLLPQSLVGTPLSGDGTQLGSLEAAYRQVALSGEPGHERVDLDFGDGDPLRFERLIVPAVDTLGATRPTHLISLVQFTGRAEQILLSQADAA